MKVKDIMTKKVECVAPSMSVREAAAMMKSLDVGPLPVCDNDRLAGMITDRDITTRVVAEGKDPSSTMVRDAMSPDIVFCFEDDDVDTAGDKMRARQVRRLVVLNKDKRLTGIVSLGDLSVKSQDEQMAGKVLEGVSSPSEPARDEG